jgi:pSer/pThr/pTyr-binding forkhead associated (FHA) protein
VRVGDKTFIVGSGGAVIGRSRDSDVVVDDANVSRRHAEIRPSGASWIIVDLGSTNGVRVNGRRIDGPQSLRPGDSVELGTSRIAFEVD